MKKVRSIYQAIKPFNFYENTANEYYCITLYTGNYKFEIMENGNNWTALAIVFLKEIMPELLDDIEFDSEFNMFCAYSSNREALMKFALNFKKNCDYEEVFNFLVNKTQLAYMDEMTSFMIEKMGRENINYGEFKNLYAEKYMARLAK